MLVLIFSDSHGKWENMIRVVENTMPDVVIHLGDGLRDFEKVKKAFPELTFYGVSGNLEENLGGPRELMLTLEGHSLYLCHGDRCGVKYSMAGISKEVRERGAEIALFGHSHHQVVEKRGETLFVNPGSIGVPRNNEPASYATLILFEGMAPIGRKGVLE